MNRHWELRKLAYEFAYVVNPRDFLDHWEEHQDLLEGCRMVFSDPRLDTSPFPGGLSARTFGSDPKAYLNAYFDAPGIFCFTNELVKFHKYGGGVARPMLDWSVSLDSNVVGDIHKFMTGKSLDSRTPAFLEAAAYLREHQINTDAVPYLIENFAKARADNKHFEFVVNGFASFYRFTTGRLLSASPTGLSDFEFGMSAVEANEYARKQVTGMLSDPRMLEEETRRLLHRQDVYLVLLLTAIEYYGNRYASPKAKLMWMMHTLEEKVGRLPERELLLALRAFEKPDTTPFFAHQWPRPYNRREDIAKLVQNMAWDLSFYRTMQSWATKMDATDFTVPYFLTFDWKLASMHDIYTCRVLLLDDRNKGVYAYSPSNLQKEMEGKGWWEEFLPFFTEDRVHDRMTGRVSYEELANHCRDAEEELRRLVKT